ncbi:alkaline shock response membrane anchor protein AmaP [Acaricomes phytoseiuli]|uniref:hypothetical protein n=1 Tax=Acaricomes phytoseiuli TaxID=291968 RepID=UPI0003755003|nr:hypothetical protein [Acaricomes phytoseiuli]MCW1249621.1 alkaline shock response membrane anchor protein AmaP [Acaricomes phytoseiuli]
MNETPRLLNRFLLAVFGVVLLGIGTGILAILLLPSVAQWWQSIATGFSRSVANLAESTRIASQSSSFLWMGVAVLLILLIIAMVLWISGQGRGRTPILAADEHLGDVEGLVSINGSVAERMLRQAIAERPEVHSVTVSAYEFKGEPGLRIRLVPSQGAALQSIAANVSEIAEAVEDLLGQPVPVLLRIVA